MYVELSCPACSCRFSTAAATPADEVVERMIDEGPWYALAAGTTFEDMVFGALARRGRILCPECLEPVVVRESTCTAASPEILATT